MSCKSCKTLGPFTSKQNTSTSSLAPLAVPTLWLSVYPVVVVVVVVVGQRIGGAPKQRLILRPKCQLFSSAVPECVREWERKTDRQRESESEKRVEVEYSASSCEVRSVTEWKWQWTHLTRCAIFRIPCKKQACNSYCQNWHWFYTLSQT